jgi:hypothetical protein
LTFFSTLAGAPWAISTSTGSPPCPFVTGAPRDESLRHWGTL